jgi:vanillate O-demethylase monooxygenase subunit
VFIRNSWYVAAWDHEILDGALFERTILGESILLFRTADGAVVALDNRCCHRQAPLSLGRREGDCVRCMYHGLKYDASGRCIEVPGQTAVPAALKLRSYPVVKKTRWIWVWMGDPVLADAGLLPDTYALDHPAWRMQPGYMHYKANHLLISDNLLDFSHLSYVHASTLGGSDQIAEVRPEVQRLERGVKIIRRVPNTVLAPYQMKLAKFSGGVDRHFIYEYLVPGVLLMESGAQPIDPAARAAGHALNFRSCQALTPETETTTHYFFMQAHDFALDDARVTESIFQSILAAFNEDKRIIEAQQALLKPAAAEEFVALPFDLALAHFRKVMQRMLAAEAAAPGRPATLAH